MCAAYVPIQCVAAHQSLVKQIAGPYVVGLTLLPYNELSCSELLHQASASTTPILPIPLY